MLAAQACRAGDTLRNDYVSRSFLPVVRVERDALGGKRYDVCVCPPVHHGIAASRGWINGYHKIWYCRYYLSCPASCLCWSCKQRVIHPCGGLCKLPAFRTKTPDARAKSLQNMYGTLCQAAHNHPSSNHAYFVCRSLWLVPLVLLPPSHVTISWCRDVRNRPSSFKHTLLDCEKTPRKPSLTRQPVTRLTLWRSSGPASTPALCVVELCKEHTSCACRVTHDVVEWDTSVGVETCSSDA